MRHDPRYSRAAALGAVAIATTAVLGACSSPARPPIEPPTRPLDLAPAAPPVTVPPPAARHDAVAPIATQRLPLDLEAVLRLAGTDGADMLRARARFEALVTAAEASQLRSLPALSLGGNAQRESGRIVSSTGDVTEARFSFLQLGTVLRYAINPGEAYYAWAAANRRVEEGLYRTEAVRLAAERDAGLLYCHLEEAYAGAALAAESLHQARARLDLLGHQAGSGLIASFALDDLSLLVARRARARQDAENEARQISVALAAVLRLDAQVTLLPADPALKPYSLVDPDIAAQALLDRSAAHRPEVAANERAAAAAGADVNAAAWVAFGPSVIASVFLGGSGRLSGSAGLGGDDGLGERSTLSGGAWETLSGSTYGELQIRRRLRDVARLETLLIGEQVAGETTAALVAARDARASIRAASEEVDAALRSERAAQSRFETGLETGVETLVRAEALAEARTHAVAAVAAWNRAQIRLLYAIGALGPAP